MESLPLRSLHRLSKWTVLFYAVTLLYFVRRCQGILPTKLNEDTCTRYFLNSAPEDPLLEKEHCTLCQMINDNAERWDYVKDLSALCTNVPVHAMDWVRGRGMENADFRAN